MSRSNAALPVLLACSLAWSGCGREDELVDHGPDMAPSMSLESPEAGAWLPAGRAAVEGSISQCASLAVNGEDVAIRGPGFSGEVELARGINVVEARAMGLNGDEIFVRNGVIAGDFGSPGGWIEQALALRLNQGGIDDLLTLVGGMLDSREIEASITGLNPVYQDTYGIWGWDAVEISADVTELSFDTPELSASPRDGELDLEVVLPDVFVGINAYGEVVGIDFDTDVSLSATRAIVTGELGISARSGQLDVDLSGAEVELDGFAYDTSLLPGDVEAYLLVDTIRGKIEEMLVEKIEEMVPALLDSTLSELDPSFETELLGTSVAIAARFASASIDEDGLALGIDLDVEVPQSGEVTYAGYLLSTGGTPTVDTRSDMAGAISDDLLNRVLFEAWRGGLLDLSLSTEDGSLDSFLLTPLHATQGTITVSADLPPVAVQTGDALQAQLGELQVVVETPDGELGTYLHVSVAVFAPIDLVFEDGELALDLGEVELSMMVRETDWGASNEATTQLVEEMLPLDTFLALLGGFSFPIPEIYGISLASGDVYRDRTEAHTGLSADLAVVGR